MSAPNTMPSFRKINEPIQRKLKDRRKDGGMDGRTLFYRTLPAEAGGPKILVLVPLKIQYKKLQRSQKVEC